MIGSSTDSSSYSTSVITSDQFRMYDSWCKDCHKLIVRHIPKPYKPKQYNRCFKCTAKHFAAACVGVQQ